MYSIAFPNMFSSAKTNIIEDHEATISNLKLLLKSDKGSLYGDPYFGTNLSKIFFSQNGPIIKDLIVDDIYESTLVFMPQLAVDRSKINIKPNKTSLVATMEAINRLDYTPDLFEIPLTID